MVGCQSLKIGKRLGGGVDAYGMGIGCGRFGRGDTMWAAVV